MSIRDYKHHYVVINGTTNEQIKVPRSPVKSTVLKDLSIDEVMLYEIVNAELNDCDSVTIFKSYMKD